MNWDDIGTKHYFGDDILAKKLAILLEKKINVYQSDKGESGDKNKLNSYQSTFIYLSDFLYGIEKALSVFELCLKTH